MPTLPNLVSHFQPFSRLLPLALLAGGLLASPGASRAAQQHLPGPILTQSFTTCGISDPVTRLFSPLFTMVELCSKDPSPTTLSSQPSPANPPTQPAGPCEVVVLPLQEEVVYPHWVPPLPEDTTPPPTTK